MAKKVVITGAEGFIGTNLALYLQENTDWELHGIDSQETASNNADAIRDFVKFHKLDVRETQRICDIVHDADIVFHLAAKGNVVQSVASPVDNFDFNVRATLSLLESLRSAKQPPNLIFASTGGALMGNSKPPVNEMSLPKPISPYGASKLACEGYINAYSESYNIRSICARFGNVYGPHSLHKTGVINKWIGNIDNGIPVPIYGDGSHTRDYIHVFDICQGLFKAANVISGSRKLTVKSNIFHLSNNKEVSLIKLLRTIEKILGKESIIDWKEARTGEVSLNSSDYSKARKDLNFNPIISLEEGLDGLVAWLRSKGALENG